MTKKTPWIGTSWKMNKVKADAIAFVDALKATPFAQSTSVQSFVIPPFPYIPLVADMLRDTRTLVGAQNMHWMDKGSWTGEVSPVMIKDCGATFVELGHSERRTHFAETDELVARKVAAALRNGLNALVCVGDTQAEFDAGATADVLARQTRYLLRDVGKDAVGKVIIAYEPVWSIGEGGVPADPAFANDQHRRLKALTKEITGEELLVVYGGSVNRGNCVALGTQPHIDGLFIGRGAWDEKDYIAILESVTSALEITP